MFSYFGDILALYPGLERKGSESQITLSRNNLECGRIELIPLHHFPIFFARIENCDPSELTNQSSWFCVNM